MKENVMQVPATLLTIMLSDIFAFVWMKFAVVKDQCAGGKKNEFVSTKLFNVHHPQLTFHQQTSEPFSQLAPMSVPSA
jgi:hypothetical protein